MNRPPRPPCTLWVLMAMVVVALTTSGCGTKTDTLTAGSAKRLTLMLDFFPNADHAAVYSAIAHGDFRLAGLDVNPQAPPDPSSPLKELAAGRVDMAISYEPELLLARDRGLRVVSIAALVQRPLTSLIALGATKVTRVGDLAGKRVGTAGIPYQSAELRTVLRAAAVDPARVQETNVGFDLVPAMLSGKVAATLGGFWNYEGVQLEQAKKKPVVIPVDRAGVPTYDELVVVVREDEARMRGQDLRGFLQALTRGEREVRADPTAAARLVVRANPQLDGRLQSESIARTLPAANPGGGRPFGYQDPQAWARFGRWMLSHGLVHRDPASGPEPFTNEYLPGQGV